MPVQRAQGLLSLRFGHKQRKTAFLGNIQRIEAQNFTDAVDVLIYWQSSLSVDIAGQAEQ